MSVPLSCFWVIWMTITGSGGVIRPRVTRGALDAHRCNSRLVAEGPRSTTGPLFTSQCPCGTFFLTPYSIMCDCRVLRAGPMLIYWLKLLYPFLSSTIFFFLFFLSIGWYCGDEVFGLIEWHSLSSSLALPTPFNNNNNNVFLNEAPV